jgi:hypothetical protein
MRGGRFVGGIDRRGTGGDVPGHPFPFFDHVVLVAARAEGPDCPENPRRRIAAGDSGGSILSFRRSARAPVKETATGQSGGSGNLAQTAQSLRAPAPGRSSSDQPVPSRHGPQREGRRSSRLPANAPSGRLS